MNDYFEMIVFVATGVFAIALVVLSIRWYSSRARALLDDWAERYCFEILYCERQLFFLGSYFLTNFRGQVVYKVRVRDRCGNVRVGFVTCGGFFCPFLMDEATVRWENCPD
jgi:hypothetical protein